MIQIKPVKSPTRVFTKNDSSKNDTIVNVVFSLPKRKHKRIMYILRRMTEIYGNDIPTLEDALFYLIENGFDLVLDVDSLYIKVESDY